MKTNTDKQYSMFLIGALKTTSISMLPKTIEMILDMRKKQNSKTPVTISNSPVLVVSSYKYLRVIIQDNLKWKEHDEAHLHLTLETQYPVCYFHNLTLHIHTVIQEARFVKKTSSMIFQPSAFARHCRT